MTFKGQFSVNFDSVSIREIADPYKKERDVSPVIDIHGYLGVSTDPTAAAATAAAAARGWWWCPAGLWSMAAAAAAAA